MPVCGLPPTPERTRRALVGVVGKVLSATVEDRGRLLSWAAGKVYGAVRDGQLTAESAAGLILGAAAEVGIAEGHAQRLIAENLLRMAAGR